MSNVITLNGPRPADYVQHFIDNFLQEQQQQKESQFRTQQLANQQQQITQEGAFQTGTLAQNKATIEDKKRGEDVARFIGSAVDPYFKSGRPEDFMTAKANIDAAIAEHPDWKDELIGQARRAASSQLPGDVENANTQQIFTKTSGDVLNSMGGVPKPAIPAVPTTAPTMFGQPMAGSVPPVAQGMTNKFIAENAPKPNQATAVPPAVQPNPQTMELFHKRNFGNVGLSPQAMKDVEAQQPQAGGYGNFLRREAGDLPTAAENLTSKTQKDVANIQETGATRRTGMTLQEKKDELTAMGTGAGTRDVRTTVAGNQWADIGSYTGKTKNQLLAHYRDLGIPALDKQDAEALREIDNARLNQQAISDQLQAKLPKDAAGRVIAGPMNKLSAYFQADDILAASQAWRAAAVQSLRATAGSKGLRINEAEIKMAVENDIPKITDTVGVAQQKLKNIAIMLDAGEQATLGKFGGSTQQQPPSPSGNAAAAFLKKHGY